MSEDRKPTAEQIAADEKMIADMRKFGKPSPKAQAEAKKLQQGKQKGGGK